MCIRPADPKDLSQGHRDTEDHRWLSPVLCACCYLCESLSVSANRGAGQRMRERSAAGPSRGSRRSAAEWRALPAAALTAKRGARLTAAERGSGARLSAGLGYVARAAGEPPGPGSPSAHHLGMVVAGTVLVSFPTGGAAAAVLAAVGIALSVLASRSFSRRLLSAPRGCARGACSWRPLPVRGWFRVSARRGGRASVRAASCRARARARVCCNASSPRGLPTRRGSRRG